jgi:hypothetical protein
MLIAPVAPSQRITMSLERRPTDGAKLSQPQPCQREKDAPGHSREVPGAEAGR